MESPTRSTSNTSCDTERRVSVQGGEGGGGGGGRVETLEWTKKKKADASF